MTEPPAEPMTKRIEAQGLVLLDSERRKWAELTVSEDRPALVPYDKEKNARIVLGMGPGGPGLWLFTKNGGFRASLAVTGGETNIELADKNWARPGRVGSVGPGITPCPPR